LKLKKKIIYILAPAVLCWCFFYLQGCKEPIIEDNNLLTSDDNLNLDRDTLHIKAYSEFVQPLTASSASVGLLGNLTDPNFGKTYAGFYGQCQLTSNNIYFGDSVVLDSAFLMLPYNGVYGKFDQPVDINVFELSQSISSSTTYTTTDAFSVNVPAIGSLTGYTLGTKLTDSVKTSFGTLAPHMRIQLTNAFANKILLADTNTLRDNTAFLNLFKGFYVSTSSATQGNGLLYMGLQTAISGVMLYYHNAANDSLFYLLPISGARVNHFDNVYTGTPVSASIAAPNPNGEEKVYLQAGAGVKGRILIKDLDSLPKNIAINKAELILSQAGGANDTAFNSPLVLNLYRIDDAGQSKILEDASLTGFGGVRIAESANGITVNRYRFNITRYFQKLLSGVVSNKGFYLETIAPASNSERLTIANSSTDNNYQIKLVITYTKL
jgi:hypothetical protein